MTDKAQSSLQPRQWQLDYGVTGHHSTAGVTPEGEAPAIVD